MGDSTSELGGVHQVDTKSAASSLGETIIVKMFGGFTLSIGQNMVGTIPGRQAISLLAYLICHRDRQHTRDLLIGQFWPDLDEAKARRRLSNALWQIGSACNKAGSESVLIRQKETVSLRPDIVVIVDSELFDSRLDDFEDRLRNQDSGLREPTAVAKLAEVVTEYDDFLAGYYGDWIDFERTRLAARHLDALEMLVKNFKNYGDYDAALRHARQLVAADPLREESHREVMRLCGLTSHVSGAKRQYELCREALRKGLDVEPSTETKELLRRVERETSVGGLPDTAVSSEPLLGRAQVLADLLTRVEELIAGRGGLVLLEGEIGMGKSRLIDELSEGARWRGADVISANHNERSRWMPYGSLCEAIAPSCDGLRGEHVAELLDPLWVTQVQKFIPRFGAELDERNRPSPTVLKGDEEGWRAAEALARVVLALGRLKPTVVVLEDLQWADDELMGALKVLSKDLADSGILLCLTYRRSEAQNSEPIRKTITELARLSGVARYELEPLSDENMRRLIASHTGPVSLSSSASEKLLDVVHGNPMFAIQVLEHPELLSRQLVSDSEMELVAADVMTEVVRQRIELAGSGVGSILELLAVLNEPTGSKLVARLLDVPRDLAMADMYEAVRSRFLAESIDGCRFVNKEIRRLVYEQIEPERRRQLHGQVFDSLSSAGGETDQLLGTHAWQAGRWEEAFDLHRRAALADLKLHAYKTARTHFDFADQAATKLGLTLLDWFDDLMKYEDALDVLAQRDDQSKLLERLEPLDLDDQQRIEVELRRVRLLAHTSRYEESAEVSKAAIARAEQLGQQCGEIRAYAGASLFWSGNPSEAIDVLTKAVEELSEAGISSSEPSIWLAKALIDRQRFDEAKGVLEKAAVLAQPNENLRFRVDALAAEASTYMYEGTGDRGVELYEESYRLSKQIGYLRGEAVSLVNLGMAHGLVGKGALSLKFFEAALVLIPVLSEDRGQAIAELNIAGISHRLIGDDERAKKLATKAAVFFRSVEDTRLEVLCLDTLAGIDMRSGRKSKAKKMLTDAVNRKEVIDEPWSEVQVLIALCEVHLQLADYNKALAYSERALACSKGINMLGMAPIVLGIKSLALAKLGRMDEAKEIVEQAQTTSSDHCYSHYSAWRAAEVYECLGDEQGRHTQTKLAFKWLSDNLEGLDASRRAMAWEKVPTHVAIREAYQRLVPIVERIFLPRAGSESSDELDVEVDLTLSEPSDWEIDLENDRRQCRLVRIWSEASLQGASPRISDLAQYLGVSERTIKRDLVSLRASNVIK